MVVFVAVVMLCGVDVGIDERRKMLAKEINEVIERKGVLLIPAFAVERTQELLADIAATVHEHESPGGDPAQANRARNLYSSVYLNRWK